MTVYNVKVRLNLDKEEHRSAYEILKNSEKSMSQFVIAAVNAYGCYLSEEEEKKRFLQEVKDAVRTTLGEMIGVSLFGGCRASSMTEKSDLPDEIAEESGEIADDFLKNF